MADKNIVIGVPHTGQIDVKLAKFLQRVEAPQGYDVVANFRSQQPVSGNRNAIVKEFLSNENNEWLLQLDDDIIPPDDILDMVDYDKKILSGVVLGMKKGIPFPLIMKERSEKQYGMLNAKTEEFNELTEVDGVGGACLLVHRDVYEKLNPPYFQFEFDEDGCTAMSEDYYFSRKCKEANYKLYVATEYLCGHIKRVDIKDINKVLYKAATAGEDCIQNRVGKKDES